MNFIPFDTRITRKLGSFLRQLSDGSEEQSLDLSIKSDNSIQNVKPKKLRSKMMASAYLATAPELPLITGPPIKLNNLMSQVPSPRNSET